MTTTTNTQIAQFQTSENRELASILNGLDTRLEQAARQNLEAYLAPMGQTLAQFTATEQLAMVRIEQLRLVNDMDLAAIVLRGRILKEIEDYGLWTVHPNHFTTLETMAEELGLSISELSDIRTMTQTIFPFIENELGVAIAAIWDRVGKAKFRAMVPVLKALITGDMPGRGQTRDSVERMLTNTAATFYAMGEENVPDPRLRRQAAEDLLVLSQNVPVRELQEHIRDGEVTPALTPYVVEADGRKYILSEVTDQQLLVLRRKLGRHMSDPETIQLPTDRRRRQQEAVRVPIIRAINRLVEG